MKPTFTEADRAIDANNLAASKYNKQVVGQLSSEIFDSLFKNKSIKDCALTALSHDARYGFFNKERHPDFLFNGGKGYNYGE